MTEDVNLGVKPLAYETDPVRREFRRAQAACVAAVRLQREALKLSRWAYLDDRGAGQLVEAADKLRRAAALLRNGALLARQQECKGGAS